VTSGEASIKPCSPSERSPDSTIFGKQVPLASRPCPLPPWQKQFLGHADENVTDTYIAPSLEAVCDAVSRAARSIDGKTPAGGSRSRSTWHNGERDHGQDGTAAQRSGDERAMGDSLAPTIPGTTRVAEPADARD